MNDMDLLLGHLMSKGFSLNGKILMIPDSYRHLFMEEGSVELQDGEPSDFVLERLLRIMEDEDPAYFRVTLPAVPDSLRDVWPSGDVCLGGCFVVQYEAHRLVESIHCGVASKEGRLHLDLDEFMDLVRTAEPAKIYFDPATFDRLVVELRGAIKDGMRSEVEELREAMAKQLEEELARVEEYYSMLKNGANSVDERLRLEREEEMLVNQYVRRLHPKSLGIRAVPVVLVAITVG